MVADKIKLLREKNNLTQSALAKKLNVTRSSVNAWEMGISVPSTALLVDIAKLFHVSTDYLLGITYCKQPLFADSRAVFSGQSRPY